MESKHRLIVYDIRDAKRLRKVEKIMESYAWRVQKSVFESNCSDELIEKLKYRLEEVIEVTEDFLLFFEVCERDWQRQEKYGVGSKNENSMKDEKFIIL